MTARKFALAVALISVSAAAQTPPVQPPAVPDAAPAAAPIPAPVPIPIAPATQAPAPTPIARPARGDHPPEQLFTEANTAFLSGDLPRASAAYNALTDEGVVSAELETNLGTALLRQGRRGLAALHFERALFLSPGDDEARADLAEVRRGNVDRLEGESEDGGGETLYRLLAPLPGRLSSLVLVAAWSLAWLLVLIRLFAPGLWLRASLGQIALGAFILAGVSGLVTLGAGAGNRMALRRAVVVAAATPAREGPALRSASPFEVHEGTLVRIEDAENGFRRIKLTNGLTGWVPAETVELIVPERWGGSAL